MSSFQKLIHFCSDYWSLMVIDHGLLRLIYRNCYRLPGGVFRSNQPDPFFLRKMIRQHGLRTIVCLRGENDQHGWFRLERGVCEAMGVTLITPTVYSRGLLTAEEMGGLIAVVHTMELPALVHCKSGADRVGFFASLYRHARLGEPIEQASRELSIRYGHFRGAKTGVLDFMFACFSRSRSVRESFRSWVMRTYNPHAIQNQFRPWAVSDWVVDRILRRE